MKKPSLAETDTFDEPCCTIADMMEKYKKSYETIRRIVSVEPGVLKFNNGTGKRACYSIPESVARRIHTRISA